MRSRSDQETPKWEPIKDLPDNWRELASPELARLADIWRENKQRLENSQSLAVFNERLMREWAIETGIIENLYSIDRGTTETLINEGILADVIRTSEGGKPAELVVQMIHDQADVLDGIFDYVKSSRPLTISYIKQLQAAFTRNQQTTDAKDTQGNFIKVPLLRGEWKKLPNNPTRPDGSVHFYAPPEHTAAEMDRLVEFHNRHEQIEVPVELEAAWLHHRFTQVHPFQDGNGRVARALASMMFIKEQLFPPVIRSAVKHRYLDSLESADDGDLSDLVNIFLQEQKLSILRALGMSPLRTTRIDNIDLVIQSAAERLREKEQPKQLVYEKVYMLSSQLQTVALKMFAEAEEKLHEALSGIDLSFSAHLRISGNDERKWSGRFAEEVGTKYGYVADVDTYRSLVGLHIIEKRQSQIEIVFHSIGTDALGILGITGYIYSSPKSKFGDVHESMTPLSTTPFTFSYTEDIIKLEPRFHKWLNEVILFGLDEWRRQL